MMSDKQASQAAAPWFRKPSVRSCTPSRRSCIISTSTENDKYINQSTVSLIRKGEKGICERLDPLHVPSIMERRTLLLQHNIKYMKVKDKFCN